MSFNFTQENLTKIAELKKRYPDPAALCLPCLWMAQYQDGFIKMDAIDVISAEIGIPPMEIYRVITFYTMFRLSPVEKVDVQVCKTLSCKLCGSDEILKHLESKDINVIHVECLGSCGSAPVMQIDDKNYENLTTERVDKILEELL
ncbi:NAD(P)H-dependent oxidoreductase subunit E [Sulfurimonas aquatica]|uniref:NAD(P)H-dependent oxidoreductase subunit E n=1 Tax=Sulfurimonas aquatica TaxID=2672570 RepID=A0A975AZE3_9BACT|nr:NAD(P)H-dependent oxidoreductase subunit E [Sulfurimonas aquatica]QSZ41401.1 NAD(P)H-dependent oxidoreductase subunit E [Sulfurimonas aquatica]